MVITTMCSPHHLIIFRFCSLSIIYVIVVFLISGELWLIKLCFVEYIIIPTYTYLPAHRSNISAGNGIKHAIYHRQSFTSFLYTEHKCKLFKSESPIGEARTTFIQFKAPYIAGNEQSGWYSLIKSDDLIPNTRPKPVPVHMAYIINYLTRI